MNDETLQRKLDQLAQLCDELDSEAERRYGKTGQLFFEAEGSFHIMVDDGDFDGNKRCSFIRFSSKRCRLGAGAW